MNAKGFVHKYGDNVDTDVIIPARYLNIADKKELATHCMEDIDKHFVDVVKAGDVMVGGFNFGCGSSREHAPHGDQGVRHLLRHRQDLRPDLLPQRHQHRPGHPGMPRGQRKIQSGDEVAIDFDTGLITNLTKGETYQANPLPGVHQGDHPGRRPDGRHQEETGGITPWNTNLP